MKRALLIEHDAWTRPGLVGAALAKCGFELDRRLVVPAADFDRPNVAYQFPDPGDYDLVVPFGSPWAADDHDRIGAWLGPELVLLRQAHERGVPVLGICFGGQALCVALGAGIERDVGWEIGYRGVETDEPELVPAGPWFQFHHDRMLPPPGAVVVARNDFGVQAWRSGRSLAVQFHPEVTPEILDLWLEHGGREVLAAQRQDLAELRAATLAARHRAAADTTALVRGFLARTATAAVNRS